MSSIKQDLESIFEAWRQTQIEDEETDKTFPLYKGSGLKVANEIKGLKAFFIPDGCVNYEKYTKAPLKVLFILKEPAMIRDENSVEYIESTDGKMNKIDMDDHWYKKLILNEGQFDRKYYNKFIAICNVLGVDPSETALMNLNKRGGYKRTDYDRLDNYVRHYADFISRQIQTLNPDIIISCYRSKSFSGPILDIGDNDWVKCEYTSGKQIWLYHKKIKLFNKETAIYGLPHPAIPMSPNRYASLFKKLIVEDT